MTSLCNIEWRLETREGSPDLADRRYVYVVLLVVTASLPPSTASDCPQRTVYFLQELFSLDAPCSTEH